MWVGTDHTHAVVYTCRHEIPASAKIHCLPCHIASVYVLHFLMARNESLKFCIHCKSHFSVECYAWEHNATIPTQQSYYLHYKIHTQNAYQPLSSCVNAKGTELTLLHNKKRLHQLSTILRLIITVVQKCWRLKVILQGKSMKIFCKSNCHFLWINSMVIWHHAHIQYYGATPHFSKLVTNSLYKTYPERRTGRSLFECLKSSIWHYKCVQHNKPELLLGSLL